MPIEQKLVHCEPTDPKRCQSTGKNGQCPFISIEGYQYCPRHAGRSVDAAEKRSANQYRLQVWQTRLEEFAESDNIKSLRDEIGILRILMEETLNKCKTATDLMIHSNKISDLAIRIEKLVTSCNRLETKMGMLLDKSAALNLAGQIVGIITTHVSDPTIVDAISNDIITALSTLGGSE